MSHSDSPNDTSRLNLDEPTSPQIVQLPRTEPNLRIDRDALAPQIPAGYGGYGAYGASEQSHLVDYFRVLHKRRFAALTTFVLIMGSITLYTFTATPFFEGRALIQIENQDQKVVQFQQVLDENRNAIDYYQTQYRILQSRLLARRTLNAEKLWEDALFKRTERPFTWNPLMWPGATLSLVRSFFEPVNQETTDEGETRAQSDAIDRFLRNLSVAPIRNSRLVEVRYRSPQPELSARIANALARQYIEQNLEFKFLATKEATEFLSARMKEQRGALEQSEQALQKYREQTGAVALEDRQNIVVQRLADLNAAVTKARTDRIEKEAVYNQVRDSQNSRALLDTVPAILTNSFIQQLKAQMAELQRQQAQLAEKFGERHPEMVRTRTAIESTEVRINAEVQKIVQALRNDYQAALANERALQNSLDQQRGEAQDINRLAIQYGVLARDSSTNRQMFDSLLQRSKETDVAGELKTSNIRIVDQAEVPLKQASPNVRGNLLLSFFGGTFLAVGLAFFLEYMDNRLKTPDEVKAHLGLPFLGMVPAIDVKELTGAPLLNGGVPNSFSEAFRSIRTNVLFSSADEGSRSIVVTSTAPGEGKTVAAANLAISIAAAGQRVLLVDADMRRPKIHEFFRTKIEPGLSNVLVGDAKASDAVKKLPIQNLWVLAAGKHPPNPAELLGSKRFREFVASLGQHFDWVVLDTPPVAAVTDASIAAHVATGVVFVIGADMTSRGSAKAALDHLDSAKAKYVGAILNKVDLTRNSYYYSRYYHKSYEEYYTRPNSGAKVAKTG